jgi:hypothetical protein
MRTKIFLFFILLLAVTLRIFSWQGSLTFGYDQARDAFISTSIYTKDLIKILGPMTDIQGLYHGVAYYYLLAPFYFLGNGNPYFPFFALIMLNSLIIFPIYFLGMKIFKSVFIGTLSALFFACSFEMTQYARWLSNPSPAILAIAVAFLGLWFWINDHPAGLILASFAIGLSVQFQLFLIYTLINIPIILYVFRPKIIKGSLIFSVFAFFLATSSMIAAEIKFGFRGLRALISFFITQDLFQKSFTDIFLLFINRLVNVFYYNLFGINLVLAGILGSYLILQGVKTVKRQKPIAFLLIWLFSNTILYFFTGTIANFISLGLGIPAILLVSNFLGKKFQAKNYLFFFSLFLIVLVGNFKSIMRYNPQGSILFSVQEKMLLKDELDLIDYTYKEAKGRPFSINTVTNPLFINTTWAYLYNWQRAQKYNYLPYWRGKGQAGYLGEEIFADANHETKLHFLIIEPTRGIPSYFVDWTKIVENQRSKLLETKNFGNFVVEKREFTAKEERPFDIPIEEFKKTFSSPR